MGKTSHQSTIHKITIYLFNKNNVCEHCSLIKILFICTIHQSKHFHGHCSPIKILFTIRNKYVSLKFKNINGSRVKLVQTGLYLHKP